MKVRIKTWEEMEKEFELKHRRAINCGRGVHFLYDMEQELPPDRIIEVVKHESNRKYTWRLGDSHIFPFYTIAPEMIAEYITEDTEQHPYHLLQTREHETEPPWWWTGKPVLCEVWDNIKYIPPKRWVIGYEGNDSNSEFRFTDQNGNWWKNAEPVLRSEDPPKVVKSDSIQYYSDGTCRFQTTIDPEYDKICEKLGLKRERDWKRIDGEE